MNRSRRRIVLALVVFLGFAWGPTSLGCPVCFGDSDAPIVKGVEMSVLFMIGITYTLLLSGVAAVIVLRRRALRQMRMAETEAETAPNGTLELPKNERAEMALSME